MGRSTTTRAWAGGRGAVWRVWLGVAAVAWGAGCGGIAPRQSAREGEHPLIKKAEARVVEGDLDAAIRLYHEALAGDADLARAHLDLALLYHDQKKEYVLAVYHYSRYLELRPGTEKRSLIEDRMRMARQALVASIVRPDQLSLDKVLALEAENETLKKQVAAVQAERDQVREALKRAENLLRPRDGRPAGAPTAAPDGRSAGPRTYRVRRGDTLRTIAADIYGETSRWQDVQEANKDTLKGSTRLVEGQVLNIP